MAEKDSIPEPDDEAPPVDARPHVAPNENPLKHYAVAVLPPGVPDAFYEPHSTTELHDHLTSVVSQEGSILDSVLYKRVARAWGA